MNSSVSKEKLSTITLEAFINSSLLRTLWTNIAAEREEGPNAHDTA